jgi:hypothetical protein
MSLELHFPEERWWEVEESTGKAFAARNPEIE